MTERYIVLRDLAAMPMAGPLGSGGVLESTMAGQTGAEPRVEVHDLSARDLRDVARERDVRAVAMPMEIALIRPLDDAGADADPLAGGTTWGVQAVGADTSSYDGEGVTVAVIDSGIDAAHPAFAGLEIVERDFVNAGPGDDDGHGTHCAGTIFGRAVDGTRIGVAPGVDRALIARVFGPNGGGSTLELTQAIDWAARAGAQIISMSLGFDFVGFVERLVQSGMPRPAATSLAMTNLVANQRLFDSLMQLLRNSGPFGIDTLVVAASGNESGRPQFEISASLPAAAAGVLSVGAVAPAVSGRHAVARFSNSNPNVVAPGVGVVSARANTAGLASLSGTSMATPHVAGVASLWWQAVSEMGAGPGGMAQMVADRLRATARPALFAPGFDAGDYGEGLITAP